MRTPTVLLATIFGVLAFSAAPALAALETPEEEKASAVTATTATLEGVLNPKATGNVEGGQYEFLYAYLPTECENVFASPQSTAAGFPKEAVFAKVTELQPSLKYTFCLEEKNVGEEVAKGVPVTFETKPAPPTIVYLPPEVKASEATLPATINPNNQEATYFFEYAASEAAIGTASATKFPGERVLSGYNEEFVSVATGPVLTQHTTYYYRVVAKNTKGEENIGKIEEFTTGTPEAPQTTDATGVTASSATLNGVLNPKHEGVNGEIGSYEFRYERSPSECDQEHVRSTAPEPAAEAHGKKGEAATVDVTGLLPGATYTYCLVAHSEAGGEAVGSPVTFTTESVAPSIGEESFDHVGSSSATLHAQLNPGGAPTTYFFEYATEAEYAANKSYASKTPVQNAGAGSEPESVEASIEGLTPETTYHFRLSASNTNGAAGEGGDTEFSTFPAGPSGLPDGRQFEIVSPLENGDATVLTGSPVRAAANGTALAYIGTAPPEGGNGEITILAEKRPRGDNVYLAKRSTSGGWNAADVQPTGLSHAVFLGFSSDLSAGILTSEEAVVPGAPNGPVGAGHAGLYSRDSVTGAYSVLEENAQYAGSTPDGSHVLGQGTSSLHDFVAGRSYPISVLPDNETVAAAVFGSPSRDLDHVISEDGSRVFWTDTEAGSRLFVREDDTSPTPATVQVDAAEPGCVSEGRACVSGGGTFMDASSDGSRVFFTDEHPLTSNSNAAEGSPDLYERRLPTAPGEPGTLTDLTTKTNTPTEHADVVGVLGASNDGSYVYFAAAAALAPNAKPQACSPPTEEGPGNRCNIYVVHEGEAPKLVATVATGDGEGGVSRGAEVIASASLSSGFGDWVSVIGERSAFVSNSGSSLVFESVEDLTKFHADGGREIYEYDADSERVSCVSCNPSGASTINVVNGNNEPFFGGAHSELAPSLSSTYQTRDISADGNRVFFESNEPLVSQLTNEEGKIPDPVTTATRGLTNVFEWEREGTEGGSCPIKEPASTSGGCIFLLSTGTSPDISFFIDASENGNDVFLGTRADLVPQDKGEVYEVYDAHQCSEAVPCVHETSTACTGTGCQGVPGAPPIFATPSSATITGSDDLEAPAPKVAVKKKTAAQLRAEKLSKALKVCHAKRGKQRGRCEASARKKFGAAKPAKGKKRK